MRESVLVWAGKSDASYREARRQIASRTGCAPRTIKNIDFAEYFAEHPDALAYFPVFQGMNGWWGEMLGTRALIQGKMIISPECQLYEIGTNGAAGTRQLFAAEIPPRNLATRSKSNIREFVKDMIATSNGTVLALMAAPSEPTARSVLKTASSEYLGHLGGY